MRRRNRTAAEAGGGFVAERIGRHIRACRAVIRRVSRQKGLFAVGAEVKSLPEVLLGM